MVYGVPALVLPVLDVRVTATATPVEPDAGSRLESTVHTGPLDTAPAAVLPTVTAVTATLRHLGVPDQHLHVRSTAPSPTARGMGSSAAVAAAVTAAVADVFGRTLDPEEHHELVQECERVAHGRPSGLDARGVVADVPVWFEDVSSSPCRSAPPSRSSSPTPASRPHARGRDRRPRTTRPRPQAVDAVVAAIGDLARRARGTLVDGDAQALGATMDAAHELLSELDVSSTDLDRLVDAARRADALGAKLTAVGAADASSRSSRTGARRPRGRRTPRRRRDGDLDHHDRSPRLMTATAVAHPNIALVKYWGKADAQLALPATAACRWASTSSRRRRP